MRHDTLDIRYFKFNIKHYILEIRHVYIWSETIFTEKVVEEVEHILQGLEPKTLIT